MQNNVLEIWVADDRQRNEKSQPDLRRRRNAFIVRVVQYSSCHNACIADGPLVSAGDLC